MRGIPLVRICWWYFRSGLSRTKGSFTHTGSFEMNNLGISNPGRDDRNRVRGGSTCFFPYAAPLTGERPQQGSVEDLENRFGESGKHDDACRGCQSIGLTLGAAHAESPGEWRATIHSKLGSVRASDETDIHGCGATICTLKRPIKICRLTVPTCLANVFPMTTGVPGPLGWFPFVCMACS
jgi:hypothetical protein